MSEPTSGARVTAVLGELELKFQRLSATDGSPLWNLSFVLEDSSVVWVTLYVTGAWVVALHTLKEIRIVGEAAVSLLALNARLLGARVAMTDDRTAIVLADVPLGSLDRASLESLLQATIAAARTVSTELMRTAAEAASEP